MNNYILIFSFQNFDYNYPSSTFSSFPHPPPAQFSSGATGPPSLNSSPSHFHHHQSRSQGQRYSHYGTARRQPKYDHDNTHTLPKFQSTFTTYTPIPPPPETSLPIVPPRVEGPKPITNSFSTGGLSQLSTNDSCNPESVRSERRKTVTFFGQVETIESEDKEDDEVSHHLIKNNAQKNEDYVESRV